MDQAIPNLFQDPVPRDASPYIRGLHTHLRDWSLAVKTATFQGVGAALPKSTSLVLTNTIHHVSATNTYTHITPPPNASGPVYLIADTGFSLGTGGNIAHALTVAANTCAIVVYDNVTKLWYPKS